MRDSVRLHTLVFVPRHASGDLPIILTRTPYGIAASARAFKVAYKELVNNGYIFVFQDIRGRFGSEGQFVMLRPIRDRRDPHAIDESTDTYDTIDWLLKHVSHNNGKVGMLGVSYPGWLTVMAMLDPHPALKAVSPQASPADMFLGDDFHHNGAFRLSYGFEYVAMMERSKEFSPFAFSDSDTYDWYLKLGSLAHGRAELTRGMSAMGDGATKQEVTVGGVDHRVPTWTNFVTHAAYDSFWKDQAVVPHIGQLTVPSLTVSGWWDQEDFYGAITIYEALAQHDPNHLNYLVVGPWNHGGWDAPTGEKYGPFDFGSETALDFRKKIEAPWFAYWLKGQGKLTLAPVTTFESGDDQWRTFESWPPRQGASDRKLYFQSARAAFLRCAVGDWAGERVRFLRLRPGTPGPVPAAPDPVELHPALGLDDLALFRPAIPPGTCRRAVVRNAAAHRRRDDRRQHHRASRGIHDGHRRRLDRQADQCVSGARPGRSTERHRAGRLRVHGRQRRIPWAIPPELLASGADPRQPRRGLRDRPAHAGLPVPQGASDHGPGAELLVPHNRPESADVRAEHLRRQGRGLSQRYDPRVPLSAATVVRGGLGAHSHFGGKAVGGPVDLSEA